MNNGNVLIVTIGAAVATVLVTLIAAIYQYNDGVTNMQRAAIERGCTVTPNYIDCKH